MHAFDTSLFPQRIKLFICYNAKSCIVAVTWLYQLDATNTEAMQTVVQFCCIGYLLQMSQIGNVYNEMLPVAILESTSKCYPFFFFPVKQWGRNYYMKRLFQFICLANLFAGTFIITMNIDRMLPYFCSM